MNLIEGYNLHQIIFLHSLQVYFKQELLQRLHIHMYTAAGFTTKASDCYPSCEGPGIHAWQGYIMISSLPT